MPWRVAVTTRSGSDGSTAKARNPLPASWSQPVLLHQSEVKALWQWKLRLTVSGKSRWHTFRFPRLFRRTLGAQGPKALPHEYLHTPARASLWFRFPLRRIDRLTGLTFGMQFILFCLAGFVHHCLFLPILSCGDTSGVCVRQPR